MSSTISLVPLFFMLSTATNIFNISDKWQIEPNNEHQKMFAQMKQQYDKNPWDSLQEYQGLYHISGKLSNMNTFLSKYDFSMQVVNTENQLCILNRQLQLISFSKELYNSERKKVIYLASTLHIPLKWKYEGEQWFVTYQDKTYPAVHMSNDQCKFSRFSVHSTTHPYDILNLESSNGYLVYMTVADKPLSGFELLLYLQKIANKIAKGKITKHLCDAIRFPMINIIDEPNIDWLTGMTNNGYEIMQAMQQIIFTMSQDGTTKMEINNYHNDHVGEPQIVEMNQPFYLWIMHPDIQLPVFAGYFDESSWKNQHRFSL